MAAKIAASATANAVQDRFMKTPSSSCPKPKALAFRGEPAFTTVLSKCDAEFAPRVDPACLASPEFHGGALRRAKRGPAQPYMLIIAGGQGQIPHPSVLNPSPPNQHLPPPTNPSPLP